MENYVLKIQVIVTFETSSLHVLLSQLKLMCLIIQAYTLMILQRLGQSWEISFSFYCCDFGLLRGTPLGSMCAEDVTCSVHF